MKNFTKTILKYFFPIAIFASLFMTLPVKAESLWSFYSAKGEQLPTVLDRAATAAQFGIFQYKGTSDQNSQLLTKLQEQDKIDNGGLLGFTVVTGYKTTLSNSMTSNQVTIPVSSILTKDGHTLTMSDLGNVVYLDVEPGTPREEIEKCTLITSSIWDNCTRGLAFSGKTETTVSANAHAHNAGSTVVMSDVHYVYENLIDKDSSETIQGVKTFGSFPEIVTSTALCSTDGQFCTKKYVDSVGAGGFTSGNVSSTRGTFALGTSPETVGIKASSTRALKLDDGGFISNITSSTGGVQLGTDGIAINRAQALTWTATQTFSTVTTSVGVVGTTLTVNGQSTLATTSISGIDVLTAIQAVASTSVKNFFTSSTSSVNNSTLETQIVSTTLPGGILGTRGGLMIRAHVNISGDGVAQRTLTVRLKYGSTTSSMDVLIQQSASNIRGWYTASLLANGATNSQAGSQDLLAMTNAGQQSSVAGIYISHGSEALTYAIDSTGPQSLILSMIETGGAAPVTFDNVTITRLN